VSTGYFIKKHDLADTFKIAAILARDEEDFVNKGSGWMLRAAGEANRDELLKFLEDHAAAMPRTLLRYATEKLDKERREFYLNLKKDKRS
jgi:3-methyladenine DNA glycosylase AlkD